MRRDPPDILNRQFDFDPSCKFWMPYYRYGAEQSKIWDQSGNQNHGVIAGAVPYIGNPQRTSLGSTYNYGDFTATNAFFWSSLDLSPYAGTDLGSTPFRIRVLDAAGKLATGYLAGVGAGEDLDDNLLAGWNLTVGWATSNATINDADTFTLTAGSGSLQKNTVVTIGALYKSSFTAVVSAGTAYFDNYNTIRFSANGASGTYRVPSSVWVRIINELGMVGATTDVTTLECQRVTDPPATAVHIVSARNGIIRDWENIEAGFNPNTITSWEIDSVLGRPCIGWYFDGVDDRIVHPSISLGKLHTLHYWIKRIGENGNVHAGASTYVGLRVSDTTVGYSSASTVAVSHNGEASTAKKTLITVTRILDKVNFYQDGLHIGDEQTLEQGDNLTLTDFGRLSDGTMYFNGVIYLAVGFTRLCPPLEIKGFYDITRHYLGA